MERIFLTSITEQEFRELIQEELKTFFDANKVSASTEHVDQFLTIDQACALLKLKRPTIYGLVNDRKIPFMKQGNRLHFSKDELTAWLKQGRKRTVDEINKSV